VDDALDPADWAALRAAGTEQAAPAGQVLVREGASGGSLFIVLAGRVAISRGGRRITELGPDSLLGEVAMLDGGPRTASAIVSQDAQLLVVPGSAVRALLDERPGLRDRLLRTAHARLLDDWPVTP
jgi:CRP/FNR family transcriptional regulator, cyclic AMP receptor protein